MNQSENRRYLIEELLKEQPRYAHMQIPADAEGQKQLLRSLMNVRMPKKIRPEFLQVQDAYLQEVAKEKGVVTLAELEASKPDLYIWKGDITRLQVGAIINAANSGMTGCYQPCHNCIDNCIHTYAGIQLRLACAELMEKQGKEEPTGQAKITPAYNLPCDYVIHTVGPIVLRFGIGNDFPRGGQVDFVLGHFTDEDWKTMDERLKTAGEIIKSFCLAGIDSKAAHPTITAAEALI